MRVIAVVLLGVVATAALLAERPPDPAPASAPTTAFSAERAMGTVDDVAREPHPLGSPASDRVRDDVAGRLAAAGLAVRIDRTAGIRARGGQVRAARVDNVVATLPGTAPTGAVVLAAHYDSVAGGPGAADDGASVAALLETVRALRSGPPMRNDVVVLVTDGEEAGLLGAQAWVRDALPRDRPTVVLNHEARGTAGPSLLFQTSPGDSGLVGTVADVAPHPRGDSSLVAIYRLLPNDTDLSEVLAAGRPGLNAAFVERPIDYHTAGDSPANLSRASLQNQGANMLAVAGALGGQDLRPLDPSVSGAPRQPDVVYFHFLGPLVTYPQALVWPFAVLAALVLAGTVALARRRGVASVRGVLTGFGATLLALVVGTALGAGLWRVLVLLRPSYGDTGPFLQRPLLYELADVAVAALAILVVYLPLRRRIGPVATACGATLLLVVLGLVTAALVPGASFLAALPALGFALGLGLTVLLAARPRLATLALVVLAVPAVVLLLPFAVKTSDVAGVSTGLVATVLVLLVTPLVPVLDVAPRGLSRRWALPVVALVAAVALAGTGLAVDRPDAAAPQSAHLAYVLDADNGAARWVTTDRAPAAWTGRLASGPETRLDVWPDAVPVRTGPAPALPVPAPTATVLARTPETVELRLASPRGAPTVVLRADRPLGPVTVDFPGRPVVTAGGGAEVSLGDVPPEGARVTLRTAPGPLGLLLSDQTSGLAAVPGFPPRPPELRRSPDRSSDLVMVARRLTV